jgi:hypothetical protein
MQIREAERLLRKVQAQPLNPPADSTSGPAEVFLPIASSPDFVPVDD